nr:MAG TPA: Protein of unknown function (DUF1492) [Caudoviricetes sp.]
MEKENELRKEYLRSYIPAVNAARRLEEEIERLRADKMAPALVMDDMPHAHDQKDLSDYAARLDELERKLIKARYEHIDLYAEIFADIERLEDETEKTVLTYRYLRRYSWEKICVEMGYQWAQVHRIHARALKNFNPTGGYYELLVKKMKDDTQ